MEDDNSRNNIITVEHISRVIARKLGHNDDNGIHWERYILAAHGIIDEFEIKAKEFPKKDHHGRIV